MWKQYLANIRLLTVNLILTVVGFVLFVISSDRVTGETYAGSFSSLFCMAILIVLSISCVAEKSGGISGWYRILIFINMILSLSVIVTNTYDGRKDLHEMMYGAETVLFACITLLSFFYWYYIQDEIGKEGGTDKPRLRRGSDFMNVVCVASVILLILNRPVGYMYGIDDAGFYQRGILFPLSWVCPILLLISCAILIIRQKFNRTWKAVHLSYPILPLAIYPLQVLHEKMMPLNIAITLALLLMYCVNYMKRSNEVFRQKEMLAVQQREMLELEVQLMISQIQPHFLYNTIAMIRGLCRENPEAAADSLGYFSSFLRGSLHMMQKKECIPIEEELKLVASYMFLEQRRFGERLEYVEDIEDVEFSIPALTIEPLLENAVHHGIEEKEEGGMILLEVTEDDEYAIVRITDDGAGFDMTVPIDTQKHIGIGNVKSRLRQMCGGTLEFHSQPGEGTTAIVKIPKKKNLPTSGAD